jgi:hypothetical protein
VRRRTERLLLRSSLALYNVGSLTLAFRACGVGKPWSIWDGIFRASKNRRTLRHCLIKDLPNVSLKAHGHGKWIPPFASTPHVLGLSSGTRSSGPKEPFAPVSEPQNPIVYYIDPSVPRSLRPLIGEAVLWWNAPFEEAGFRNAFRVEELPAGIDPFAPGINLILWIPRSTRGWSWRTTVVDPRTGEILKAIVHLDAMRLRADQLLFDGLSDPHTDHPDLSVRDEALRQRLRLLVAHVWVAKYKSGGDRSLKQTAAMLPPRVTVKRGWNS